MTKFARRCLYKLRYVVQHLDRQLGPGTADLSMRIGIHSGQVTAGVLRGEKSRFQLFGDTGKPLFAALDLNDYGVSSLMNLLFFETPVVNTAARMESTGAPNCVHISQQVCISDSFS